jgi:hypothetical protein
MVVVGMIALEMGLAVGPVAPGRSVDAAQVGGRVVLSDPFTVLDTRWSSPGGLTQLQIGSGVLLVTIIAEAHDAFAVVRPCGQPASPEDPGVAVDRFSVGQLRVARPENLCLSADMPVNVMVVREGTVAAVPQPGGLQFVSVASPIGLFSGSSSTATIPLGRPPSIPNDAAAAVVSVMAAGFSSGSAYTAACGSGSSPVPALSVPTNMPATVEVPRMSAANELCLNVSGGPVDVDVDLLGWLAPSGPDAMALPPMYSVGLGESLEPGLVPMTPERVLDTRNGIGCAVVLMGGVPICFPPRWQVGPHQPLVLSLAPFVTPWTTAVSLNLTVTGPVFPGFVTVWECEKPKPATSNLNFDRGQTVANLVVATISEDATLCIQPSSAVYVIADLMGVYDFAFGEPGESVTPSRFLDTRNAIGVSRRTPTVPGEVVTLRVAGVGDVPTDADAVTMNVTAVNASAGGFVTVWPCDAPRPDSSNLNFVAGGTRPNLVTVALSASGTVCFYTSVGTHLLADVGTWFGPAGTTGLIELAPDRILDTRNGIGAPRSKLGPDGVLTLQVRGRGGVDLDAESVVMNVTATRTESAGFVTVWPCDAARPEVSNLNFAAGETSPNLVSVKLSASGTVCLSTSATTDLLADVAGFMTSTPTEVVGLRLG